ncbi:ankyrin repeat-containing domain protein [Stachybotrys elegans]|uniref:Ankyrin repeat-containing domain protein n=1 Tax=Stachybotrys elegans TaxID=80388 RepID=A0A8K0S8G3_9HYPO|nr:ankyrin repeat-containing domain protein [Stachybotrys elegans]
MWVDDAPNSNDGNFELGQAVVEASKRGFTDIIRLLHQRGAALTVRSNDGMSPLHDAAYGCHEDTVRFLLLEGTDPNKLDNSGRSPSFCGCESGSDAIVALLREKGASVTRANSEGQTLLHLAVSRGNVDVVQRLIHTAVLFNSGCWIRAREA